MKPNLGDVLADKYRLDRVLGEGGMSMVFAATNVLTGKQVAIKWLQSEAVRDEEQSKRLLREAQATSAIDHPNVVNLFDVGRHGDALFLVMELLHGEPLSELLARGACEPGEFIKLMMPILRGVHAAHRLGIVHRDLKPDNIFICRDPHGEPREPKVVDFGISKLADDALAADSQLTREGTVFGTPQYMAPEQMRDARIADIRSDVYALGVIFYRALADQYPYDADTLTALAIRIVEGDALALHELRPDVDVRLSDVVMRALALDPDHRYQSVAALGQALEPFADGVLFNLSSDRDSSPTIIRPSFPALSDSVPVRSQPLRSQSLRNTQVSQRLDAAAGSPVLRGSSAERSPPLHSQPMRSQPLHVPPRSQPLHVPPRSQPQTTQLRSQPLRDSQLRSQLLREGQPLRDGQPLRSQPLQAPSLRNSQPLGMGRSQSLRVPPPPPPSAYVQPSVVLHPGLEEEHQLGEAPAPVAARPSGGLDVPLASAEITQRMGTQRIARASSRRRTLLVGAALFTIGSVAPVAWQALNKAQGASKRSAAIVSQEQPSTRFAMSSSNRPAQKDAPVSATAALAASPIAPPPQSASEQPAANEVASVAEPDKLPRGIEPPLALELEAQPEEPTPAAAAKPQRTATRVTAKQAARSAQRAVSAAVAATPPAIAAPAERSDEEAAPPVNTERNPYLR